jgi:hypothetical protein
VKVDRQTAEGKIWVHARICRPGEPDEDLEDSEEIEVQVFDVEPAYARVGAGVTKKIREYESLRVDVGASIPCYREQLAEQMEVTAEFVAERLDIECDKYLGEPEEDEDDGPPATHSRKKKVKKKSKSKTRKRRSRRDT